MVNRERLLQEDHVDQVDGPWRVLVICQCLNMTTWMQAELFLEWFFTIYPTHNKFLYLDDRAVNVLLDKLRPLGLCVKRQVSLRKMTRQYAYINQLTQGDLTRFSIADFAGCGRYTEDAWKLFVLKEKCSPRDKQLRRYAEREGLLL